MEKKRREPAPKLTYTQSPNVFYDEWLREIKSLSELKVVEIVIRYTFGWHSQEVLLSLHLIQHFTGLTAPSAVDGIRRALDDEYIVQIERGNSFGYRLNVEEDKQLIFSDSVAAVRFVKSDGRYLAERIPLPKREPLPTKESLDPATKESLVPESANSKDSLDPNSKDSLEVATKESLDPYKDKEKSKENRNKKDLTTTTTLANSEARDIDLTSLPIPVPDPYPITDEERAWAAENCPLVDLEAETDNFIGRNNGSDERHPRPADVPLTEWRRRWRKWIRKGQKFEERDAKNNAAHQNGNRSHQAGHQPNADTRDRQRPREANAHLRPKRIINGS